MRYLAGHLPPRTFAFTLGKCSGTVLELTYHGIVFFHQLPYLVVTLPYDLLIQFAEVDLLHLLSNERKRRRDPVRNEQCDGSRNKEYERIQVNNGHEEV